MPSTGTDPVLEKDIQEVAWLPTGALILLEGLLWVPVVKAWNTPYNAVDTSLFEYGILAIALISLIWGIFEGTANRNIRAAVLLLNAIATITVFAIKIAFTH